MKKELIRRPVQPSHGLYLQRLTIQCAEFRDTWLISPHARDGYGAL